MNALPEKEFLRQGGHEQTDIMMSGVARLHLAEIQIHGTQKKESYCDNESDQLQFHIKESSGCGCIAGTIGVAQVNIMPEHRRSDRQTPRIPYCWCAPHRAEGNLQLAQKMELHGWRQLRPLLPRPPFSQA